MQEQNNSFPSAKLISHVLIDFSSEAEMDLLTMLKNSRKFL